MADDKLIKKEGDVIKSASQKLVSRSLSSLIKGSKDVLLCDVSYSMDSRVDMEHKKIDILRAVLKNFEGATIYEFSTEVKRVFGTVSDPNGGTDLTKALRHMHEKGVSSFVLLTDGEPDDAPSALMTSKGLKISIVYIGPKPAPQFLKDLAKACGGVFEDVDLSVEVTKAKNLLTSKIKGLLGA